MKKITALLLAVVVLLSFVACAGKKKETDNENENENGNENEEYDGKREVDYSTTMDIYLIAGQSNAVGFSRISNMSAMGKFAPEVRTGGFTNVHYAGSSRHGGNPFTCNEKQWGKTTIGAGANSSYIGPELGMAKALSKYYNEETERHAGIIKFAHG
ncbi:MAG: hypothetical protein IIU77_02620, partial [Clostridia bacterium]|nr:hypothetical protein [Clostridia bacterium]